MRRRTLLVRDHPGGFLGKALDNGQILLLHLALLELPRELRVCLRMLAQQNNAGGFTVESVAETRPRLFLCGLLALGRVIPMHTLDETVSQMPTAGMYRETGRLLNHERMVILAENCQLISGARDRGDARLRRNVHRDNKSVAHAPARATLYLPGRLHLCAPCPIRHAHQPGPDKALKSRARLPGQVVLKELVQAQVHLFHGQLQSAGIDRNRYVLQRPGEIAVLREQSHGVEVWRGRRRHERSRPGAAPRTYARVPGAIEIRD